MLLIREFVQKTESAIPYEKKIIGNVKIMRNGISLTDATKGIDQLLTYSTKSLIGDLNNYYRIKYYHFKL